MSAVISPKLEPMVQEGFWKAWCWSGHLPSLTYASLLRVDKLSQIFMLSVCVLLQLTAIQRPGIIYKVKKTIEIKWKCFVCASASSHKHMKWRLYIHVQVHMYCRYVTMPFTRNTSLWHHHFLESLNKNEFQCNPGNDALVHLSMRYCISCNFGSCVSASQCVH